MGRFRGRRIAAAVAAIIVLVLVAGCASAVSPGSQPLPRVGDIFELPLNVTVPPCPEAPTGVRLQLGRFPGDMSLHLRAVGLEPGEKISFFIGCGYAHDMSSVVGSEIVGRDGLLLDGWQIARYCSGSTETYRCIAVVWTSDMLEGSALACAETTVPACWAKEAGMYCGHLGLCVALGLFLFLLAAVAFLRPRTFGARDKTGWRGVALVGTLVTLAAAHCFDCADEGLKQYMAKTFHVWPYVLASVLFELAVTAALVLLLRFLILRVKRDRTVGWIFLLGGLGLVSLFPLTVAVRLDLLGIGPWTMSNLVPGKMLSLAAAAVAAMGAVVLSFRREETAE